MTDFVTELDNKTNFILQKLCHSTVLSHFSTFLQIIFLECFPCSCGYEIAHKLWLYARDYWTFLQNQQICLKFPVSIGQESLEGSDTSLSTATFSCKTKFP